MKSSKRKTRSDKFPLTLHSTVQYCKKIKGRIRNFGTDKKKALERYVTISGNRNQLKAQGGFGNLVPIKSFVVSSCIG